MIILELMGYVAGHENMLRKVCGSKDGGDQYWDCRGLVWGLAMPGSF